MDTIYVIAILITAIIELLLIIWIFEIRQNTKKRTELLQLQIDEQKTMQLAEIELLAGIAEKLGVPLKGINEVLSQFDIEYEQE